MCMYLLYTTVPNRLNRRNRQAHWTKNRPPRNLALYNNFARPLDFTDTYKAFFIVLTAELLYRGWCLQWPADHICLIYTPAVHRFLSLASCVHPSIILDWFPLVLHVHLWYSGSRSPLKRQHQVSKKTIFVLIVGTRISDINGLEKNILSTSLCSLTPEKGLWIRKITLENICVVSEVLD